jgi:predicted hotdog family 3-hydroxylacyl-ACP dehydratase
MTLPKNFPIPVEQLIPHRPPLRLVDLLLEHDGQNGVVQSTFLPGNIGLLEDGSVEQSVMVELIAQSFAAVKGYTDLLEGKPVGRGYLVGVKRCAFLGTAFCRERLLIHIAKTGETDEFSLAEGRVMREEEVLTSGNVMVWIPRGNDGAP